MTGSSLHEETVVDVVAEKLDDADEILVVNPTKETIRAIVDHLSARQDPPTLRALAAEAPLKELTEDFLVASAVADLVADGTLSIRTLSEVPRTSLLVAPESVTVIVDGGNRVAGLTSTDDAFVDATVSHYETHWEQAPEFSLRTPPLSQVRETLADDIGQETAADFDAVLETLDEAKGNGNGLDEVTISLLVAGRNGELLYDISKWGEDVGLASKATFSRTKTRLEEEDLIDTEKVPIDVGRPRLRLRLDEERLDAEDIDGLVRQASDHLAEEA